ncbi:MAG: peptide chain release factor 2 [Candidatus Margulisiibacteriota bacterium]
MLEDLKPELIKLKEKINSLKGYLNIDGQKALIQKLQAESSDPNLWKNPEKAKVTLQNLKNAENLIAKYEYLQSAASDAAVLLQTAQEEDDKSAEADLTKELTDLAKRVTALELFTFLNGPYDKSDAIVSINAGAGGTDAQDWADILLRMFTRWSEQHGYLVEMPDISYGEEAGIKSATLIISGEYAYGYLKCERGIHRLVRMSPFNADGKRHTSFASVEVIPEVDNEIKTEIDPKDLRIDTFRASGPGGQNVNKVSSAIRITHIPTGIVTQSQSDRSQHANKSSAMKILKARLYECMLKENKAKIEELVGEKKDIGWGNQIRSYVFQPYTMVKDHRTGFEVGDVQKVLNGDLDGFMEAMLKRK